jgi:L-alanine-DL-glutamate epimerase-like enolase superfamily enzyme
VNHGGIRYMQFDCTRAGGITEWLEVASYAATRGVGLAPHHDPQIHGHLLARYADAICECFPNPKRDPVWAEFYKERPQIRAGMLHLTGAPGLGVEFNPGFLERYATRAS